MKNKVNINGVEIEKIIENPQHLGGLVSKFNELLDALDEKKEEKRICQACNCGGAGSCSSGCQFKHICGKEEPKSTLRHEISYEITYAHGGSAVVDKTVDQIISLFKDTLLKEIDTYFKDAARLDSWGVPAANKQDVTKLINNL